MAIARSASAILRLPPRIEVKSRSEVKLLRAVILLADGARQAHHSHCSRWQYAIQIQQLAKLGLQETELHSLVRCHLVTHACELQPTGPSGRRFRRPCDACFTPNSCFVLTNLGIMLSRNLTSSKNSLRRANRDGNSVSAMVPQLPAWDAARRMLSMNGVVLKRFKRPAENQEIILSAFHEESWPARIDDPLPPIEALNSKRRLNDAVKSLNRNHLLRAIQFSGDGTGQGIVWERC